MNSALEDAAARLGFVTPPRAAAQAPPVPVQDPSLTGTGGSFIVLITQQTWYQPAAGSRPTRCPISWS
jgi:hypothetical protein